MSLHAGCGSTAEVLLSESCIVGTHFAGARAQAVASLAKE